MQLIKRFKPQAIKPKKSSTINVLEVGGDIKSTQIPLKIKSFKPIMATRSSISNSFLFIFEILIQNV